MARGTRGAGFDAPASEGRGRIRGLWMLLVLVLMFALPLAASAEGKPKTKLGRGAANTALGILALPGQITQTTREHGPAVGLTWGLLKGVVATAATEVVGVWEIVTCPFEWPPEFGAVIRPDYPWQYFQSEADRPPRPTSAERREPQRVR